MLHSLTHYRGSSRVYWALVHPYCCRQKQQLPHSSQAPSQVAAKGQMSQAKRQRQHNTINIHFTNAASQAINLLSWRWSVGNLTRMFSAFNYSPMSLGPGSIWKLFQGKVEQRQERESSNISVHDKGAIRAESAAAHNNNIQMQTGIIPAAHDRRDLEVIFSKM